MILRKTMIELSQLDFALRNVAANTYVFKDGDLVDYLACGRKQHLFHFILSGTRSYEINKQTFEVHANEILFIPHGTKYSTTAHNFNDTVCSGIGIVFDAVLEDGTNILPTPYVYHSKEDTRTKEIFQLSHDIYNSLPIQITKLKSLVLELISHLANKTDNPMKDIIKPALDYFSLTYKDNLPIQEYADKCNLSESYFRKIFRETIGMSPIQYRNELRFAEADRLYLQYRNISRVAEEVGFCSDVFFTKLYKKRFGTSIKNNAKLV